VTIVVYKIYFYYLKNYSIYLLQLFFKSLAHFKLIIERDEKMNSEKLNAEQILEIASSQWATAKDIMMLGSVGRNKAYAIRSEISLALYSDNTKLRNIGLVPMVEVLKYFSIDLNYLKDILALHK